MSPDLSLSFLFSCSHSNGDGVLGACDGEEAEAEAAAGRGTRSLPPVSAVLLPAALPERRLPAPQQVTSQPAAESLSPELRTRARVVSLCGARLGCAGAVLGAGCEACGKSGFGEPGRASGSGNEGGPWVDASAPF